jgi:hypothetical protein
MQNRQNESTTYVEGCNLLLWAAGSGILGLGGGLIYLLAINKDANVGMVLGLSPSVPAFLTTAGVYTYMRFFRRNEAPQASALPHGMTVSGPIERNVSGPNRV